MAKSTKLNTIIEELQNASKMHLRQSKELSKMSEEVSPLKQNGKGCADTPEGCIRKGQGGYYILNNKKGGTWRDGFDSRSAAVDQLKAIHSN
jgi:hypothetical protein|tara:strand:+ start:307 stop:582 length:276 start_codon:yes stop_codon:yes gene_type:complete